ncbi:MAG: type II secretion system protein [Planctomycetota bacterium]|nr:type II secretion system protein [Planctomycetota bacterium]
MNRPPRPSRGFTLIELIAVMLVMSILGATAISALGSFDRAREAAAARALWRDIEYARERSLATGRRHWVVFNLAANSYSLLEEPSGAPSRGLAAPLTDVAAQGPLVRRLGIEEAAGVSVSSADFGGTSEVGFDWLGRPLSGAASPLVSDGSATLSAGSVVTVSAGNGMVSLDTP